MKTAEYIIELHNKGGPYEQHKFVGTRREARAKARDLTPRLNGHAIHFVRYVDTEKA